MLVGGYGVKIHALMTNTPSELSIKVIPTLGSQQTHDYGAKKLHQDAPSSRGRVAEFGFGVVLNY